MNSAPSSSSKPAASSTCITSTVGATLRDCTSTLSTDCPTVLYTRASTASFARRTTAGVTVCPAGCDDGRDGSAVPEVPASLCVPTGVSGASVGAGPGGGGGGGPGGGAGTGAGAGGGT